MRENVFLKYLTGNDPQKTVSNYGLKIRRCLYPVVKRLSGPLSGIEGVLLKSKPLPKGPKIFAVTHTFNREDVAWGLSFAGEQSYLVTNGKQELLKTTDGYALWINGVILVDRYDKENRKACMEKAKRVLELGGNVLMFPEGVWNMSPNLLVRKLYSGVYRISNATGVPVIPISTMMYDKMYVIRGEALNLASMKKTEAIELLRDTLATQKWEIMERYGQTTRDELLRGEIPDIYWKNDLERYIATQTIYEREEENMAHYEDEADKEYKEILNHLNKVAVRKETAFLFGNNNFPRYVK